MTETEPVAQPVKKRRETHKGETSDEGRERW